MTTLQGITWGHTRGFVPMVATAQRFHELHPDVEIHWKKRTLQEFADAPVGDLARTYDLLVIDHPWAGFAARSGVLLPLDEWLPPDFLKDQEANSVGASHRSYSLDGHQWALATDTATPLASFRPDLIHQPPATWEDMLALADAGKVAVPGIPCDTTMNFYMMCCALGEEPCETENRVVRDETGLEALRLLRELGRRMPKACFDMNPIQVAEAMTREDDWVYCPFAYGYSNYSRDGYARRPLKYTDVPSFNGTPLQTTLGGAGLAISANCKNPEMAAAYAQMVAHPLSQRTLYFENGGQPGHRSAWLDDDVNRRCRNFFKDTLKTLDNAFLRPRYNGYLHFQELSGIPIREYMMQGGSEEDVMNQLNTLYAESLQP